MPWLDKEGKPMISNHVLKVPFLDGLLLYIGVKVRPIVDSDMKFDAIVGRADNIQTTSKPGGPHWRPPPRKSTPDEEWSAGKPIQFTESYWQASPYIEADKKPEAYYPAAKNLINFEHFRNGKTDDTNSKQYDTTID